MLPDAKVFKMPRRESLSLGMFQPDMEAAGVDYKDAGGRVADFHALRHTFIINLAQGGIHPKTAQALARHSTITLTMDRYTHSLQEDQTRALDVLPDLSRHGHGQESTDKPDTNNPAPSQTDWAPNVRKHAIRRDAKRQPAGVGQGETETKKAEKPLKNKDFSALSSGESGIRTHGGPRSTPVFKTGAFNRSAISPGCN